MRKSHKQLKEEQKLREHLKVDENPLIKLLLDLDEKEEDFSVDKLYRKCNKEKP